MKSLLQVQINIVLSILLIILLCHAHLNMNRRQTTNHAFMWIMRLTCVTLILEIFSILLNSPNLKQFMLLHKLVNIIGFILTPTILFIGYIFSKEWINRFQREKIELNTILLLPLVINGITTMMSINGRGAFYLTNENIYVRGPLFFILPCVSYIYFGYNLYFIYKHRRKFTSSEVVIFSSFYIIPAVFTSIQLRYTDYLTTWSSTAIIIVFTYVFILNDQANRDSLTGLQNRLAFENYAQNIAHKKFNKLFIVYIDIDEFKKINDQYGHDEGDEAIRTFASLLVKSFLLRKNKVIRLGGDEFIILVEEEKQEKVAAYLQNLTQNVEAYNNREEKQYKLKFSYGMAFYTNEYKNIHQLLKYVDQLMYEQKQVGKRNYGSFTASTTI